MIGSLASEGLPVRHRLFDIDFDVLSRRGAALALERVGSTRRGNLVVTANVQHVVLNKRDPVFREALARASVIVADGMPLVWASRLLRQPVPERITGTDLLPEFLRVAVKRSWSAFFLGGRPGVADRAAARLKELCEGLEVVGTLSPDRGFEKDTASEQIVDTIRELKPDVLVLALGSPRQEVWAARHLDRLGCRCVLPVGSALDIYAGDKRRAPRFLRQVGLEWFWGLALEPRRLSQRYLLENLGFLPILFEELRRSAAR